MARKDKWNEGPVEIIKAKKKKNGERKKEKELERN